MFLSLFVAFFIGAHITFVTTSSPNIYERSIPSFFDSVEESEDNFPFDPITNSRSEINIKDVVIGRLGGTVTLPCPALNEYFNGGGRFKNFNADSSPNAIINNIDTENTVTKWYRHGSNRSPIYIVLIPYPPHVRIDYDGRTRIIPQTSSLVLSNLKFTDQGVYMCKILYLKKPADTRGQISFVKLLVQSKPKIVSTFSPNFYARLGQSMVTFNCSAKGVPKPIIYWEKVEEYGSSTNFPSRMYKYEPERYGPNSIDNEMRRDYDHLNSDISTAILTLSHISRHHKGSYRCVANNSQGSDAISLHLNIAEPPIIVSPPKNVTTLEGLSAKFECKVTAFPNNVTFNWLKDGQELNTINGFTSRFSFSPFTGSLSINPTKKSDSGHYSCHPQNGIEPVPVAKAYLNIQYPATVVWDMVKDPYYLPRNMPGSIECPIESNPPMQFVIWSKEGKIMDYSQATPVGTYQILPNGTLFITNVTTLHEGLFSCTPYNKIGTAGSSKEFRVVVRDPPTFSNRPNRVYNLKARDSITIPCVANGDPTPSIAWKRDNGKSLPVGRSFVSAGNLTITSAQKDDHGLFICQASNNVASITTLVNLKITDTSPQSPSNLSVEPGVYGALVKWTPGYDGGHRQHFILWYKKRWSQPYPLAIFNGTTILTESPIQSVQINDSYVFVIDLEPNTEYAFQIQARNALGLSPKSPQIAHRTRAYSPPKYIASAMQGLSHRSVYSTLTGNDRISPPLKISAGLVNGNIVLKWRYIEGALSPLFYTVEYRVRENVWKKMQHAVSTSNTDSQLVTYTVSKDKLPTLMGVGEMHKYAFRVRSYTVDHMSQPSEIFEIPFSAIAKPWLTRTLMAGIIGGISFFLLASTLALMAILIFCRSKQRKIKLKHENTSLPKRKHRPHKHHKPKKILSNGHAIYEPNPQKHNEKTSQHMQSPPPTCNGANVFPSQPHQPKEHEQHLTHAQRNYGLTSIWNNFRDTLHSLLPFTSSSLNSLDDDYEEIAWDDKYMSCKISNLLQRSRAEEPTTPDQTPVYRCQIARSSLSPIQAAAVVNQDESVQTDATRDENYGLFKRLLYRLSPIPISPKPSTCLNNKITSPLKMVFKRGEPKCTNVKPNGNTKELQVVTISNIQYRSSQPSASIGATHSRDRGSQSLTRSDYTNNCNSLSKTYYRYGDDFTDDLTGLYTTMNSPNMSRSLEVGHSAPLFNLDEEFSNHLEQLDLQQQQRYRCQEPSAISPGVYNTSVIREENTFETTLSPCQISSSNEGSKDSDKDSGIHAKEQEWNKVTSRDGDEGESLECRTNFAANLRGLSGQHPEYVMAMRKTVIANRHSTPKDIKKHSECVNNIGTINAKYGLLFRHSSCENLPSVIISESEQSNIRINHRIAYKKPNPSKLNHTKRYNSSCRVKTTHKEFPRVDKMFHDHDQLHFNSFYSPGISRNITHNHESYNVSVADVAGKKFKNNGGIVRFIRSLDETCDEPHYQSIVESDNSFSYTNDYERFSRFSSSLV